LLASEAMRDIAHLLRPGHLAQLRAILDDPEASNNDKFVALDLLKNAVIAAGGVLPMCQDTGTAIIKGKKGQLVFTGGGDEAALARAWPHLHRDQPAVLAAGAARHVREKNTGDNLPAEIEICRDRRRRLQASCSWRRAGGSANKSYLFQETKALLNPARA
jgi:fumarate hydratase class I